MQNWQPSASIQALKQRAEIIKKIRHFFEQRNVLEVETPLLASAGVTDLHLENLTCQFYGPGFHQGIELYLQTSPEYAMKRLIAAGSGCIYQICKAFRNDESGRYHNPEFTMLEWYRMGFNHFDLIDETEQLLDLIINCGRCERLSYQQAFLQFTKIDPLNTSVKALQTFLAAHNQTDIAAQLDNETDLLQWIFADFVEPKIGQTVPCFIYHFPKAQASLAKINQQDIRVAERFEVYFKGIELANGFHELTNAAEQQKRFEQDNQQRIRHGKEAKPIDQNLLAALEAGLPDCAGIALGIDRLTMLALNHSEINQSLSFDLQRC
ncbi:elongation factor P--(R)-beta-lysine ligase [Catenovulum sp. 2E275]|uniref:elongation factor P--(R)-beta-lysine ligase n=1 Tax=Catenovulum sp. 2E275 TaxID=2980497 RepID=UPI0021D1E4B3|nr:elongation factor P--(R)-beta-lysine ligase [Catenovulum sp. 2E275]MCU4676309.1 elongation factor P--(R)-beta-lysine ligase [Catenovulum sp. 2E275]